MSTAFAVSALASNWERLGKPFNPLLGETYELERPEFRAVCEQVQHISKLIAHCCVIYFLRFLGSKLVVRAHHSIIWVGTRESVGEGY